MTSGRIWFREDILAPSNVIAVDYEGKDPFWICPAALKMMRDTLKISSKDMREDDVRWDVTGDMREFFGVWRAKRAEDRWTVTWVKIKAHGFINKERMGSVKVRLEGWLETKFKYKSSLARYMWMLFNYMFYWRQRRSYIDTSKDDIMSMREQVMRAYGILK